MSRRAQLIGLASSFGVFALLSYMQSRKPEVSVTIGEAVIDTPLVFPVDGASNFGPTFGAPRDGHTHQGVDIFATEGTPVRAVVSGAVVYSENTLGGQTATLIGADNTSYYYAHLSAYEGAARSVRAGEVIGYVGHTGNASQTPAHLHFEIHPHRGDAIDPYDALMIARGAKVA